MTAATVHHGPLVKRCLGCAEARCTTREACRRKLAGRRWTACLACRGQGATPLDGPAGWLECEDCYGAGLLDEAAPVGAGGARPCLGCGRLDCRTGLSCAESLAVRVFVVCADCRGQLRRPDVACGMASCASCAGEGYAEVAADIGGDRPVLLVEPTTPLFQPSRPVHSAPVPAVPCRPLSPPALAGSR